MDIRQSVMGIYRSGRALARPLGGALAVVVIAACSSAGDSVEERAGEGEAALLSGAPFEGSDGNLVIGTPGAASVAGATDWANAPHLVKGADRASGGSDNAFGQGTKEDSTAVSVVSGSIPPNKNDLSRFYVASDLANKQNYLYLAWERVTNTGNANLDFEINQHSTSGFTDTKIGAVTLNRTAGDLLITYDFGGSGAPALGLLRWVTAGPVSQCFSASALPCWGNRVDLTAQNDAEGAVNTVAVDDPLQSPTAHLGPGLFGEAAINLTTAGVFPAGTCTAFGSAFVKSRSSTSFGAEIKDFVAPQPIDISNCTLQLDKVVDKAVASPGDTLTYTVTYTNPNLGPLTNVVVSDTLPSGATFTAVSASPSINCASQPDSTGVLTCTTPSLAAGVTGTVIITVKLDPSFPAGDTTIVNTATMTATEAPPVTAQASTVVHAAGVLGIVKTVDHASAAPGSTLAYTLTYTNSGGADLTGVVITDALPDRTTFVDVTAAPPLAPPGCALLAGGPRGTVICDVGTLAAGATGTVTINVKLDAVFPNGTTTVANTAVIDSNETPPVSASAQTSVGAAARLIFSKKVTDVRPNTVPSIDNTATARCNEVQGLSATGSAKDVVTGSTITYEITLDNSAGDADATEVHIDDTLPAGTLLVSFSPGPSMSCTAPTPSTVSCYIQKVAATKSVSLSLAVRTP